MAFMSLAGTSIGWVAYDRLGRSISTITAREIPLVELMNDVASLSLQIRAEAPLIIAAESDTEVANVAADLNALTDKFSGMVVKLNHEQQNPGDSGAALSMRAQDLIKTLRKLESAVRQRATLAINLTAQTTRTEETYRSFNLAAAAARGGDLAKVELLSAKLAQYLVDGGSSPTPLMVGKFLMFFRAAEQEVAPLIDRLPESDAAIAARVRELIAFGSGNNGIFTLRYNLLQAHDEEKTALFVTMDAADLLVTDAQAAVAVVHNHVLEAANAADRARRTGSVALQIVVISSVILILLAWLERQAAEKEIANLAFHDQLTHLPNRRLMNDRLGLMMGACRRHCRHAALMLLDMDNFKSLNDSRGHLAGDLMLIEVARRATVCLRVTDTVARLGGDEFVLLVGELDRDKDQAKIQAAIVAEKIRASLANPYTITVELRGSPVTFSHNSTPSIGISLFFGDSVNAQDILKRADTAMYQAKTSGKNKFCFYEDGA